MRVFTLLKQIRLKFIVFFFMLVLSACFLCACDEEHKGIILFNSVPINQNNALHDKKVFAEGTKIYYLFIAPQKMTNDYIRIQVFKLTDKFYNGGEEVVRTKDYRLMKDERYYHTDYFVLYQKGRYGMQVFSHNDFARPIAVSEFIVE